MDRAYQFGPFRLEPSRRALFDHGKQLRLGARALDILIFLVENAGEVVSKADLMAKVWPGVFVEEANLRVHVAALRKILGDGHSGEHFISNVAGRGYAFVAPVVAVEAPPEAGRDASPRFSPVLQRTIGREKAIDALVSKLGAERLITLVGPGGIGKTTLAMAAAAQAQDTLRDGVCLVDLGSVSEPRLVADQIASTLGCASKSTDPLSAAIGALLERQMLIVLDNCEHLIQAAAKAAEAITTHAPQVRLLATSREPLRAANEQIVHVAPLEAPKTDRDLSAAKIAAFAAVRLFVERAQATVDGFKIDESNAAVVSEICRRLDGIPLAIELAAATLGQVGLHELRRRLDDRFAVLTQGRRTALPHQRTLRAALDWSYDQLPTPTQAALRRLSIFLGPFTLEAASAVLADLGDQRPSIELVAELVTKSLVVTDFQSETPHFSLLKSTRVYGREKLAAHDELETAGKLHAEHYHAFVKGIERAWTDSPPPTNLDPRDFQIDNIRAALDWVSTADSGEGMAIDFTVSALRLLSELAHFEECQVRIERLIFGPYSRRRKTPEQTVKLINLLGLSSMIVHGRAPAPDDWEFAYAAAQRMGNTDYCQRMLWGHFVDRFLRGHFDEAIVVARRFGASASKTAPSSDKLIGDRLVGTCMHVLGDHKGAAIRIDRFLRGYVRDRLDLVRYFHDQRIAAQTFRAEILWMQGFPDSAAALVELNIAESAAMNHAPTLYYALAHSACPVSLLNGDLDAVSRYAEMALQMTSAGAWSPVGGRAYLAAAATARGAPGAVEQLSEALEAARENILSPRHSWFIGLLAEARIQEGRIDLAGETLASAVAHLHAHGQKWCEPELLRVQGKLLAAQNRSDEAAQSFARACALARRRGALSLELRAALALARFRPNKSSLTPLSSVLSQFTEGHERPDHQAARELLERARTHSGGDEVMRTTPPPVAPLS